MKYFILSISAILVYSEVKRRQSPKVYFVDKLPFNYNALCLPPIGIFITKNNAHNEYLIVHELIHWKQFKKLGLLAYIANSILTDYDKNKLEIEARINENDFCRKNYTYCIRNGLSKTVYNPSFRK
jgi:hypothetical protein